MKAKSVHYQINAKFKVIFEEIIREVRINTWAPLGDR